MTGRRIAGGQAESHVVAANRGWRRTQSITFTFREKGLYRIETQLKPTPLVYLDDVPGLLRLVVTIGLLALVGTGIRAVRQRLGPPPRLWQPHRPCSARFGSQTGTTS